MLRFIAAIWMLFRLVQKARPPPLSSSAYGLPVRPMRYAEKDRFGSRTYRRCSLVAGLGG